MPLFALPASPGFPMGGEVTGFGVAVTIVALIIYYLRNRD